MKLFTLNLTLKNGSARTLELLSSKEINYILSKNACKIASHSIEQTSIINESMYNSIEKVNA